MSDSLPFMYGPWKDIDYIRAPKNLIHAHEQAKKMLGYCEKGGLHSWIDGGETGNGWKLG